MDTSDVKGAHAIVEEMLKPLKEMDAKMDEYLTTLPDSTEVRATFETYLPRIRKTREWMETVLPSGDARILACMRMEAKMTQFLMK